MTPAERLELLLDLIADALIQSEFVNQTKVTQAQKFIRNGQIQQGSGAGVLALFQKDIKANKEDVINSTTVESDEGAVQQNLQEIANNLDFNLISILVSSSGNISISGGEAPYNGLDITSLLTEVSTDEEGTSTVLNPLNVSQFIPLQQSSSIVNIEKANEFLDTNIFELLPTGDTRQARIIRFFQELNTLLPPNTPEFGNPVEREEGTNNWTGSLQYSKDNSISYAQDNTDGNIDEEEAFIHRLKETANDTNSARTIEDIYNTILPYLTDILETQEDIEDGRPEYRNESSGYLKFRNPNQGIIIRNTNQDYLEGLDPNNPTYLQTGFTITMWVRFLDKVSSGTLFNFGNPLRGHGDDTSFGFRLETFVINGNEKPVKSSYGGQTEGEYLSGFSSDNHTWKEIFQDGSSDGLNFGNGEVPSEGFFSTSNTERFVRLVVNDGGTVRGSHTGMPFMKKRKGLPEFGMFDYTTGDANMPPYDHAYALMTNTRIPEDFNEWYFICASFNPLIDEDNEVGYDSINNYFREKNFWLNHINPENPPEQQFTNKSNYGNKCKVEIISRSDLLRARGFKVD